MHPTMRQILSSSANGNIPSGYLTPLVIDVWNNFFRGVGFRTGQVYMESTLDGAVTAGTNTASLASVTNIVVGELMVVNGVDTYVIQSVDGGTKAITVYPMWKQSYPSGTTVISAWLNDFHPGSASVYLPGGYRALGKYIANAKRIYHEQPGTNILNNGNFDTVYTDANGKATCPSNWVSVVPATLSYFGQSVFDKTSYNQSVSTPDKAGYFGTAGVGSGMKSDSYALTPGYHVLRGDFKYGANGTTAKIGVYKVSDDSAIVEYTTSSSDIPKQGCLNTWAKKFYVADAGNYYVKVAEALDGAWGGYIQLFFDNFALYRAHQQDATESYIFDADCAGKKVVFFGDSWISQQYIQNAIYDVVCNRVGRSPIFINEGIGGHDAAACAAIIGDVLKHKPYMCVINVGANDANGGVTEANFCASMDTIVNTLKANRIIPIIISPAPYAQAYGSWGEGDLSYASFLYMRGLRARY